MDARAKMSDRIVSRAGTGEKISSLPERSRLDPPINYSSNELVRGYSKQEDTEEVVETKENGNKCYVLQIQ